MLRSRVDMNWEGAGKAKTLIVRPQPERTTFSVSFPIFSWNIWQHGVCFLKGILFTEYAEGQMLMYSNRSLPWLS